MEFGKPPDSLSFEDEKTLIDECIDEIKSYSFPGMDDDYISERAAIEVPSFSNLA